MIKVWAQRTDTDCAPRHVGPCWCNFASPPPPQPFSIAVVAAALSSFGLLTVLCKFCLQPAGTVGEKGTSERALARAHRYRSPVALRISAVRSNTIGIWCGRPAKFQAEAAPDIFSLSRAPEASDYGNFVRAVKRGAAELRGT